VVVFVDASFLLKSHLNLLQISAGNFDSFETVTFYSHIKEVKTKQFKRINKN
jgi:hypothetical protein